ncbi:MAG: virion morphogenesis protein [Amylibacter sp.]|nr:virion morphogenesis protein [Amylibacter sp.]
MRADARHWNKTVADRLSATFRKPFPEQIAAFRVRLGNLVPTARWDDITGAAHDRGFMVAGAVKADLLADLAQAVDKAIAQGTSLEEFRRDFRQIVTNRGWHGWTGEGSKKGEAWRTRIIYQTNAKVSYAAGRLAQLHEGNFKFWVYRHGGSLEPRPQHLAWDGLILPPDHPFWVTHGPPNGWGCSCYVIGARSLAGARRVGGNPNNKLQPGWEKISPRTGTPDGIDKGWDHAPGASAIDTILAFRDKLDQLPERPSVDLIANWLGNAAFTNWLKSPKGNWPLVRIPAKDAKLIGSQKTVADMSASTARKQLHRHPELITSDYAQAQRTISEATNSIQDGVNSFIYILEDVDTGGHVLVVKATQTGKGLFVTSFRRISRDLARRERTIAQLLRKG